VGLASVLPGLRDLRGPLASGYLWLITIWLAVASRIPDQDPNRGVVGDLYNLSNVLSALGVAVVLSFGAYLLGAMTEGLMEFPIRAFPEARRSSESERRLHNAVRERTTAVRTRAGLVVERIERYLSAEGQDLGSVEEAELKRHVSHLRDVADPNDPEGNLDVDDEFRARYLKDNDDLLAARLLVAEERLFQVYDRWRAESEVRLGVVPPLVALTIELTARAHPLWLLLVMPTLVLACKAYESAGDQEMSWLKPSSSDESPLPWPLSCTSATSPRRFWTSLM
jgi:hypothetical protein